MEWTSDLESGFEQTSVLGAISLKFRSSFASTKYPSLGAKSPPQHFS